MKHLRTFLLSFEHVIAALGATLTVPLIVNGYGLPMNFQTVLLMSGVGTLVFALCTKGKIPVVLSSSFAFLSGFSAVAISCAGSSVNKLAAASGGAIVAGAIYLVLALLCKVIGTGFISKLFPPVVVGPLVMVIGLGLVPSAVTNMSTCWWIAILTLVIFVTLNVCFKGIVGICALLISVLASTIVAGFCGLIGPVSGNIVGLPAFVAPKFDLTAILIMAPIAIVSISEHISDINSVSAATGENYIQTIGLHRTLLGDGLSTMLSGAVGVCPTTTYSENISLLTLTKEYNPTIIHIAAVLMMILGFSPKFASAVQNIPVAIVGGASLLLYATIASVGIKTMITNKVELGNTRNLVIVSLILSIGLGFPSFTFTVGGAAITVTAMTIAAVVGIIANIVLPKNI